MGEAATLSERQAASRQLWLLINVLLIREPLGSSFSAGHRIPTELPLLASPCGSLASRACKNLDLGHGRALARGKWSRRPRGATRTGAPPRVERTRVRLKVRANHHTARQPVAHRLEVGARGLKITHAACIATASGHSQSAASASSPLRYSQSAACATRRRVGAVAVAHRCRRRRRRRRGKRPGITNYGRRGWGWRRDGPSGRGLMFERKGLADGQRRRKRRSLRRAPDERGLRAGPQSVAPWRAWAILRGGGTMLRGERRREKEAAARLLASGERRGRANELLSPG